MSIINESFVLAVPESYMVQTHYMEAFYLIIFLLALLLIYAFFMIRRIQEYIKVYNDIYILVENIDNRLIKLEEEKK